MSNNFAYKLRVDGLRITNTRAFHQDTDVLTMGVTDASHTNMLVTPLVIDMGDLNNGYYPVNATLPPIFGWQLEKAIFYYMVANSGYGRANADEAKTATNAISDVGAAVAAAAMGSVAWAGVWAALDELTKEVFNKMIFADCDGVVAADGIALNSAMLESWTSGFGMHSESRPYAGSPSAAGCGSNSFYYVGWSVIQVGSNADQPPDPADPSGGAGPIPPYNKGRGPKTVISSSD